MRRFLTTVLVLLVSLGLVVPVVAAPKANNSRNFTAHLTGDQEVPPRETLAQGQAHFKVSKDGESIEYKLNVANIENVRAAHIHCAAAGANGSVGVTLFSGGGLGRVNGTLAQGTITVPDSSNGCGWTDVAEIVAAMESGNTYVNVHTNDGIAPGNTGPGDFQSGEIRGQIR